MISQSTKKAKIQSETAPEPFCDTEAGEESGLTVQNKNIFGRIFND